MSIDEIKDSKKLKEMLRAEIMDNKYLRECCEAAGIELSKKSLQWDGKPKNLVVYAMALNEVIDKLEKENEQLKKNIMQKCPICGESFLSPKGSELYDLNYELKQTLVETKKYIVHQCEHCRENYVNINEDTCSECYTKEMIDKVSPLLENKEEVING